MRESALWIYGPFEDFPAHPWKDDMFDRRDKHQAMLANPRLGGMSLGLDIGYVLSEPTDRDEKPQEVIICKDPVFDSQGSLIQMSGTLGDIEEYPVILDHWAINFRYKINKDGLEQEYASGIGLPAERLINNKTVQQYGNDKAAAERDILAKCDVALNSYNVNELEKLGDEWGGGKVIFKPRSGSWGIGIEVYNSLLGLEQALKRNEIPRDGIVQPYLDLTHPIPNLKPLTSHFADQLKEVNSEPDRVREFRNHLYVTTTDGITTVETYPLLRTSRKGAQIIEKQTYTPLDPEAFQETYGTIHENAISVGQTLSEVADTPYLYAVLDMGIGKHFSAEESIVFAVDLNCRGPRLPDLSCPEYDVTLPAQKEFVIMQKTMARNNL